MDAGQLFAFEVLQADGLNPLQSLADAEDVSIAAPGMPIAFQRSFQGTSLLGRYDLGPLGRGWTDNWQWSLSTAASDGTVTILAPDEGPRIFQPDTRQPRHYISQPGDQAELLLSGDKQSFTLRETDGTLRVFSASDGLLRQVADSQGDRITCQYTSGRLTKLTHSSGAWLQIDHNSAGRIATLTEPLGRKTLFAYDAAQEHLTSVQYYDGELLRTPTIRARTRPCRTACRASPSLETYTSISTMTARGRLQTIRDDVPSESLSFSYHSAGKVTMTDRAGSCDELLFRQSRIAPESGRSSPTFRPPVLQQRPRVDEIADSLGRSYVISYDGRGNLQGFTDPLGHRVQFTYRTLGDDTLGSFYRLASFIDPNGNAVNYAYDSQGNLTATTYADGSQEFFVYQGGVNPTSSTNRRGQQIGYTYDTAGRIASKTYPDGTRVTYEYDARGNLTKTTDSTGTTTFLYDANDYLQQINYPSGRFLKFTYDAAGRRSSLTDQANHVTNYRYDAVGRLQELTDASGRRIILYEYDSVGRLCKESKGNGTWTTYQYNAAGQVEHLVNHAPDGSILSRFDYAYDGAGLCSGTITLDGQWTYRYDADGQLIYAKFQSDNPAAIPNQELTYQYDGAGESHLGDCQRCNHFLQGQPAQSVHQRWHYRLLVRPRRQPGLRAERRRRRHL